MSEELKRCPFCGSKVKLKEKGSGCYWAICSNCVVNTELTINQQFSTDTWNTRPIEDTLQAENARLREENQRLMQAITFKQNECLEKLQQALAPQKEEKSDE
jgi:transcription elongation factor Elf1